MLSTGVGQLFGVYFLYLSTETGKLSCRLKTLLYSKADKWKKQELIYFLWVIQNNLKHPHKKKADSYKGQENISEVELWNLPA